MLNPETVFSLLSLNVSDITPLLFLFTPAGTLLSHAPSPLPPPSTPNLTIRTLRDIAALLGIAISSPVSLPSTPLPEGTSLIAAAGNNGRGDVYTMFLTPEGKGICMAAGKVKEDGRLLVGVIGDGELEHTEEAVQELREKTAALAEYMAEELKDLDIPDDFY